MFSRTTPYATTAADQPIFQMETRQLAWASDKRTFTALSLQRIRRAAVNSSMLMLVLMGGLAILQRYNLSFRSLLELLYSGSLLLALVGVLMSFQIDFLSIAASVNSINGDVNSGRWDLYKLAGVREGQFTVGKHAIAQVRVWRTVMTVIGVRGGAAVLFIFASIISTLVYNPIFSQGGLRLGSVLPQFVVSVILMGIPGWFFLIEPILRLRAMTAVGLMISAHVRSASMSPLAAFGVTAGIWIAQIAFLAAFGCGMSMFLIPLMFYGSGLVCGLPIILGLLIAAMHAYYEILKNFSLRRAAFRLASLESNS